MTHGRTRLQRRGVVFLAVAALVAAVRLGAAATLTVDPAGTDNTTCGTGPGAAACRTIGYAIANRATAGDTLSVAAGTYVEQLVINKSLTFTGAGPGSSIIQAPAALTGDGAIGGATEIINVTNAAVVTITGFTVQGPGQGICASLTYGVFVGGGANLTFTGNTVQHIRDNPLGGCQNGIGIRLGSRFYSQQGSGTVSNNTFTDIQKGAVVVDGPATSPTSVSGNTITGIGPTPVIAQNGVQVSRSATASVTGNTISGFAYTGPSYDTSAAVLVYDAASTTITGNSISGSDDGVALVNPTSAGTATISGNTITSPGGRWDAGIWISDGYTGATISGNMISGATNLAGADLGFAMTGGCPNNGTNCVTADGAAIDIQPSTGNVDHLTISGNVLQANTLGIHAEASGSFGSVAGTVASNNCIIDNSKYGVQSDNGSSPLFDAQSNWWGTPAGPPVGSTPNGVTTNVDASLPLATSGLGCTAAPLPNLTIVKQHTGSFTQGQTGATYAITVSNGGTAPTSGPIAVTDSLPASLTATALAGTGWTCTLGTLSCTRSDALAAGSSFPPITVTVNVAATAPASVTNSATVAGGGEINTTDDAASDATAVLPAGSGAGIPALGLGGVATLALAILAAGALFIRRV